MAGLGIRGPVPDREENLARPRERKGKQVVPVTKGVAMPARIPEPDPDWHDIAVRLWESLRNSGQSEFYQESDWAFAYHICEELSTFKRGKRRSAQMFHALNEAMARLLITEGDRRRVRIELEAPREAEVTPGQQMVAKYKQVLGVDVGGEGDCHGTASSDPRGDREA